MRKLDFVVVIRILDENKGKFFIYKTWEYVWYRYWFNAKIENVNRALWKQMHKLSLYKPLKFKSNWKVYNLLQTFIKSDITVRQSSFAILHTLKFHMGWDIFLLCWASVCLTIDPDAYCYANSRLGEGCNSLKILIL